MLLLDLVVLVLKVELEEFEDGVVELWKKKEKMEESWDLYELAEEVVVAVEENMLVKKGEEVFGEGQKARKTVKATKVKEKAYAKVSVFLVLKMGRERKK